MQTTWDVRDGILYGGKSPTRKWVGTWLLSEREYGDFILEVDFKFVNGGATGNGGVALRAPLFGRPSYNGMELQITDPRYEYSLYRSDRLEMDREFAQDQMKDAGLDILPRKNFESSDAFDAIAYVRILPKESSSSRMSAPSWTNPLLLSGGNRAVGTWSPFWRNSSAVGGALSRFSCSSTQKVSGWQSAGSSTEIASYSLPA